MLTPVGSRGFRVSACHTLIPGEGTRSAGANAPPVVCIAPILVRIAPLAARDAAIEVRITRAGFCNAPPGTRIVPPDTGAMRAALEVMAIPTGMTHLGIGAMRTAGGALR